MYALLSGGLHQRGNDTVRLSSVVRSCSEANLAKDHHVPERLLGMIVRRWHAGCLKLLEVRVLMKNLSAIQLTRRKLNFVVHFILWLILVFRIVGSQWPILHEGSSFGIYQYIEGDTISTTIIDFPSHFNFVQKTWRSQTTVGTGSSIYSAQNHLKVTSEWAGMQVPIALPFGYSPTMLWVLLPLVPFTHATAFFLFNVVGLLAVYWMTHPGRSRWGIGILIFLSLLADSCFGLGQSAILTGAGLLFLAETTCADHYTNNWRNTLTTGFVLWALTAKPTIALIAVPVLISLRSWRTLALAVILTIATTLLLTPWLGEHWARDYISMAMSYDKVNAGPHFAWSLHPEMMSNLRGIRNVYLAMPDDLASHISSSVWFAGIVGLIIIGLRFFVSAARLWSFSILMFLLFCPHVTRTEVLQVSIILSLSVTAADELSWADFVLLTFIPLIVLLHHPNSLPAPGFISQALLLICLIFFSQKASTPQLLQLESDAPKDPLDIMVDG